MNVLLITSDQHRGDCYGFAGRRVRTPHLDRLRSEGTWMRNCITPSVVCQPARASMLTGLLPLTHGVCDNGIDLDESFADRGFAAHLSRHGYHSAFIGKAHFSTYKTYAPTGRPECIESSAAFGADWYGPYMGFEHVELMLIGHNWFLPEAPPRGLHYERWYHADGDGEQRNALYRTALPPDTGTPQTFHSALPPAWHNTSWVTQRTIAFIRRHAAGRDRGASTPFVLWASYPDPHHPFDAPEPWSRLHAPASVDIPVHRTRDLERRPWWHRASLESRSADRPGYREIREAYSRMPELDERQLRELTANYYGMIAMIDDGVGRILRSLDDAGLADDTLVVFTADHGDWLGDHGLVLKGPMMYDGLLRVGAIVRGPGVVAGRTVEHPVSTLDLASTIADFAGASAPGDHGASWRGLLTDAPGAGESDPPRGEAPVARDGFRDARTRAVVLDEWQLGPARCGVALDLRTAHDGRWRLTLERGSGAGELYDLREDPHELDNRFDDPGCRSIRDALVAAIDARPDDIRAPMPRPVGQA
ncbi:MAG: sulfatase-like hydrolase/transferase [Lautropia sp.]